LTFLRIIFESDHFIMEHYTKGINKEEVLAKDKIPLDGLPADFLWMKVTPRSNLNTLMRSAMTAFNDETEKCIVWSGSGPATEKAVACAEIMKKRWRSKLHQQIKICYIG
jgi:Alba